ncbi:class I SAM-dependent methyltransferase [Algiphilus sp. W345]|uniref:Class I SAM-dependent methyltransferase n=1 Tax=Banduia mediterranea TaxID=3075609 RepID=A0ABU2WE89_9GAMM|nr:class I SAM-dependent methyltransferase [Algiphilus sp. W345]MDT0496188.1 class I SAM-dependent methyltransferase [Algiphilus sp. W345]
MSSSDSRISPTAHYTGMVWARNGLSHRALESFRGRAMYTLLQPVVRVARRAGVPDVDQFLLTRHRLIDARLVQAVESGAITQVVEIAAGLSPRGWRFKQRFGDRIEYIEADLPGMAALKRAALKKMGASPGHRVVAFDALADEGPLSLSALCAGLDRSRGMAIVTEGLVNYFSEAAVRGMWRRFAKELAGFSCGAYWSDLFLSSDVGGKGATPFIHFLSAFVRGKVHLHFAQTSAAEQALRECGFADARLLDPGDHAEALGDATGISRSVRVVEARVAAPSSAI